MNNNYDDKFFENMNWLYKTVESNQFKILLDKSFAIVNVTNLASRAYNCSIDLMIGSNLLMSVFFQHSLETYITSQIALTMASMQDEPVSFIALNTQRDDGYEVIFVICQRYLDSNGNLLALELSANHLTRFIRFYSLKALNQSDFRSYFSARNSVATKSLEEKSYCKNKLLGQREHEILFLLFQCSNSEEIATVLSIVHAKSITPATVRWIVTQSLCQKFSVYNQLELLEKAHKLGYDKEIPRTLLFDGIILLN